MGAGPADPSADVQGLRARLAGPSADVQRLRRGHGLLKIQQTARADGARAESVVRPQTARADDALADPVAPSADDHGRRRAGWACWSVSRRKGLTTGGPCLLVRPKTSRADGVMAGPAGPSARPRPAVGARAGPADLTADGQGRRRAYQTCWFVRRRPWRAGCGTVFWSVCRRPGPTACRSGLLVSPKMAIAEGARAGPAGLFADGQGRRRAGRTCWSVRRRSGPTGRRPSLLVRPQTASSDGTRAGPAGPSVERSVDWVEVGRLGRGR